MSTIAYIDSVTNLSSSEKGGVLRSLTRKVIVRWTSTPPSDYQVLLQALATAGVPAAFSSLPGTMLVVADRSVDLIEEDPGTVSVVLKYEHILDGAYQMLQNPTNGVIYGKGKCSINQKPTNFYRPFGDPSQDASQILVAHTFPRDDPDVPGRTMVQGGEINVPYPQGNFQFEGIMVVNNPWNVVRDLIRTVNITTWLNQPELTWLCSDIDFSVLDASKGWYRFSFEFQNDPDTWNPTVVFNDQRTGRPPADILPPTSYDRSGVRNLAQNPITGDLQPAGVWYIPYLRPVNYNEYFGAYFEGLQGNAG